MSTLSENVTQALSNSREEVIRLGHDHMGIEHMLLGLIRIEEVKATQLLFNLGCHITALKEVVEARIAQKYNPLEKGKNIPFTKELDVVLKGMYLEAYGNRRDTDFRDLVGDPTNIIEIRTVHLLSSLLRDDSNIVSKELQTLQAKVRRAGRISAVLLGNSVIGMAIARYL